jgi:hypothetical protein
MEIARRICADADATAKTLKIYAIYARYFEDFSGGIKVLELGVHKGESLKVWASYFPQGTIIGLDLDNKADFSAYPNIVFEQGDQTDTERLRKIARGGLDIVIDDASHIGEKSLVSYATLFPYLNPGGLYIIEDWGTGYFNDSPDGKYPDRLREIAGHRILSHDFGMVGFVKSLVDDVAGGTVKPALTAKPTRQDTVSFMHVYKQAVIVRKA